MASGPPGIPDLPGLPDLPGEPGQPPRFGDDDFEIDVRLGELLFDIPNFGYVTVADCPDVTQQCTFGKCGEITQRCTIGNCPDITFQKCPTPTLGITCADFCGHTRNETCVLCIATIRGFRCWPPITRRGYLCFTRLPFKRCYDPPPGTNSVECG